MISGAYEADVRCGREQEQEQLEGCGSVPPDTGQKVLGMDESRWDVG